MPELNPSQIQLLSTDSASNTTSSQVVLSPKEKELINSAPRCVESNACKMPEDAPDSHLSKEEAIKQEKVLRQDHARMKRAKELVKELLQKNANLKEAKKEYKDAQKLVKLLKEKGALSKEMEDHIDDLLKQGRLHALKDPKHSDEILLSTVKEVRELLNQYLERWNESIRQSTIYLFALSKRASDNRSSSSGPVATNRQDSTSSKLALKVAASVSASPEKKVDPKTTPNLVLDAGPRTRKALMIVDAAPYQADLYTPEIFVATEFRRRAAEKKEREKTKDEAADGEHEKLNRENVNAVKRDLEEELGKPISFEENEIPHCAFLQNRDSIRLEIKSREGSLLTK